MTTTTEVLSGQDPSDHDAHAANEALAAKIRDVANDRLRPADHEAGDDRAVTDEPDASSSGDGHTLNSSPLIPTLASRTITIKIGSSVGEQAPLVRRAPTTPQSKRSTPQDPESNGGKKSRRNLLIGAGAGLVGLTVSVIALTSGGGGDKHPSASPKSPTATTGSEASKQATAPINPDLKFAPFTGWNEATGKQFVVQAFSNRAVGRRDNDPNGDRAAFAQNNGLYGVNHPIVDTDLSTAAAIAAKKAADPSFKPAEKVVSVDVALVKPGANGDPNNAIIDAIIVTDEEALDTDTQTLMPEQITRQVTLNMTDFSIELDNGQSREVPVINSMVVHRTEYDAIPKSTVTN